VTVEVGSQSSDAGRGGQGLRRPQGGKCIGAPEPSPLAAPLWYPCCRAAEAACGPRVAETSSQGGGLSPQGDTREPEGFHASVPCGCVARCFSCHARAVEQSSSCWNNLQVAEMIRWNSLEQSSRRHDNAELGLLRVRLRDFGTVIITVQNFHVAKKPHFRDTLVKNRATDDETEKPRFVAMSQCHCSKALPKAVKRWYSLFSCGTQ
jgi:hypothetical protein